MNNTIEKDIEFSKFNNKIRKNFLVIKGVYFLYPIFILAGIRPGLAFVLLIGYSLLSLPSLLAKKIDRPYLILTFAMLLSLAPVYLIATGYTAESPIKSGLFLVGMMLLLGIHIYKKPTTIALGLLMAYLLGIGLNAFYITWHSYITDPLLYGYGTLSNPWTGEEMNSPGVSNSLAILAVTIFYAIIAFRSISLKLALIATIPIIMAAALFLGGRTFFVIVFVAVLFLYTTSFSRLVYLILFTVLSVILVSSYATTNTDFSLIFETAINRFEEKGTDSSGRGGLLIYGLSEFWFHPFGGITTKLADSGYTGIWFHNVFMDNARLGGILPVFALVFAIAYILLSLFKKEKSQHYLFYFISFITAFLLMQQDVVIEGSPHLFIIIYLTGLLMLQRSKVDGNNYVTRK